ncbi:MAG: tRNA (adenosine(37)-N6)-threonylcarbamoyltransferase complex transferase subunit TsaD [Candidatus Omnitrophica bacterium]|nr:tRNA (adenosine(37)-N6)-threonylcarbamoyltransferase complex transferase subunit TsaD [Candidatus Omnitrophota bacterium]
MYTLGIETSCDETSCAILKNNKVLSNVTLSSLSEHKKYGGVVPEIATRAHLVSIDRVVELATIKAKVPLKKINLIAVTQCPGLIGSLVVGLNFAKALSLALKKPFIGVNHLQAHIFSPFLDYHKRIPFPFLGLVVSGGHTEFYRVDDFDRVNLVGSTRDDACGEVFDKVAKAYGLGYPGGPLIDRLFNYDQRSDFKFNCGRSGLDLSFSGIKTALIYKKIEMEKKGVFDAKMKKRLLSSFQYAALEAIIAATEEAVDKLKVKTIVCGGGVTANSYLRRRLKDYQDRGLKVFIASKEYTGDNAAMVAGLGFYLYNKIGKESNIALEAKPN